MDLKKVEKILGFLNIKENKKLPRDFIELKQNTYMWKLLANEQLTKEELKYKGNFD